MDIRGKKRRFIWNGAVCLVLFTACIVLLVLSAFETGWSADLTEQKMFTLGGETRDVLKEAEESGEVIRIASVYQEGKEETAVINLLKEYEKASPLIRTECIDAERNPAALAAYDLGDVQAVYNGTLIVECGERIQLIGGSQLFGSENGANLFYGEREITGAIRYVTAKTLPVVYFLAGHGELPAQDNLGQAVAQLRRGAYEVRQLVILQEGIPEDASILVMASPKQDIVREEQEQIQSFLQRGGKLLLFTDPVMTTNQAVQPLLGEITAGFGIDISNNYVVEEDSRYHLAGESLYLIPRFSSHEITAPIGNEEKMVVLPMVKGLGQADTGEEKVDLGILLLSSDKAWARNDMTIQNSHGTSSDIKGPIALGFASERQETGGTVSRAVVIGDSDFVSDANYGIQANANLFMNSVNWLQGGREIGSLTGKVMNSYSMPVRGDTFARLAVICCIILPLIAFGAAVYIWRTGRNR